MWHVWGKERCIQYFGGETKERDSLKDTDVDGRIIKEGGVRPRTGHEGRKGEQGFSCTLYLTTALDGGGWLMPGASVPSGKTPGTHCVGGWVGPRVGLNGCGKCCFPLGFDPRTVQPVASRCIDYTIPIMLDHE